MMEIKNSGLDFAVSQMPQTSKTETTDSASAFKHLLEKKHHEKGTEHKETSHPHKDKTTEGEEAARLHTKSSTNTSAHTDNSGEIASHMLKPIEKKDSDDEKTDADTEDAEVLTGQACNLEIPLNVLYGKIEVFSEPFESSPNVPLQLEVIDTETGQKVLMGPVEMMGENQKNFKQGKADDANQKQNSLLNSVSLKTSQDKNATEEAVVLPTQTGKAGEQPMMLEKEKKKSEESLGVFQEKTHEPKQTQHIQSNEALTSQVTVKADNLEELESKLAEQIVKQVHSGKKELEVQLDPKNLGKIHIKVSYEENQLNVSVTCSESKTLKMLSHSAVDLGNILESNINRPVQVIVDKQETNYLNNQQEQGNGGQQQRQQQENRQEQTQEDFIQKLRLGILETESLDNSYAL